MTGNVLLDLAISVVGVALLVGLSRFLFGASSTVLDKAAAAARLAFDEPDFEPVDWLISSQERAALARNDQRELALVIVHGDRLVTRRICVDETPPRKRPYLQNDVLIVPRLDITARACRFDLSAEKAREWLPAPTSAERGAA